MSSQKGNTSRTRPQKHRNRTGFKNDLHDTNHRTKFINSIQVGNVCAKCRDIIEWKIKYKKYKPLSQPRTCVRCNMKNVKQAYHVMCMECGRKDGVCTKCCQSKEIVATPPPPKSKHELDAELKNILSYLPERKKRTFLRYLDSNQKETEDEEDSKANQEERRRDLLDKLNSLKVDDDKDEIEDYETGDDGDSDT